MKVMLAAKADIDQIRFPVLASPKIDGIRAVVVDGVVMSRNMKPIPNRYVQRLFGTKAFGDLDGELVVGKPNDPDVFRKTTSGVMSVEGEPDVTFYVFDTVCRHTVNDPFTRRLRAIEALWKYDLSPEERRRCRVVPHTEITTRKGLIAFEEEMISRGYEGVMIRDPHGPYKFGRSTAKEGYLLKLKNFEDSEAIVIGFECQYHNANEAKRNAAGKLERSTKKSGKVALDRLGTLTVRDIHTGVEFDLGTGFTDAERDRLWKEQDSLFGRVVKYRYFPSGSKEKPRFPTFVGFRDRRDL